MTEDYAFEDGLMFNMRHLVTARVSQKEGTGIVEIIVVSARNDAGEIVELNDAQEKELLSTLKEGVLSSLAPKRRFGFRSLLEFRKTAGRTVVVGGFFHSVNEPFWRTALPAIADGVRHTEAVSTGYHHASNR